MNKLSKLQKWILLRAAENTTKRALSFQEQRDALPLMRLPVIFIESDITAAEVLVDYFQFPSNHTNHSSGKSFDPILIGRARYQSAYASVSRAFKRLIKRGLFLYCVERSIDKRSNGQLFWCGHGFNLNASTPALRDLITNSANKIDVDFWRQVEEALIRTDEVERAYAARELESTVA